MEIDLWSSINVGAERTPPLRKMGKLWGADRDRRPEGERARDWQRESQEKDTHSAQPSALNT